MSAKTRLIRAYNITVDDLYRAYVIIRDALKAALWFRARYTSMTAFNKWFVRMTAATFLIGGLPGLLLAVPSALFIAGPMPSYADFYSHNNWAFAFVFMTGFLTFGYYFLIGRKILKRLEGPLKLKQP